MVDDMMGKIGILILTTAFVLIGVPARADDIEIAKGKLAPFGSYFTQALAVTNHSPKRLKRVLLECGFFKKGAFIINGRIYADNVAAGQTAYVNMPTASQLVESGEAPADAIDKTECRVAESKSE